MTGKTIVFEGHGPVGNFGRGGGRKPMAPIVTCLTAAVPGCGSAQGHSRDRLSPLLLPAGGAKELRSP